jgi:hypothetical protein
VLAIVNPTRRITVAAAAGFATAAAAVAWNAVQRAAHGDQFFTDAPLAILPASWQDTGSGIFALAMVSLVLGFVVLPSQPARRIAGYACLCGLAAFVVDVYLY